MMIGAMDGWMNGWTDGWVDGWIDGLCVRCGGVCWKMDGEDGKSEEKEDGGRGRAGALLGMDNCNSHAALSWDRFGGSSTSRSDYAAYEVSKTEAVRPAGSQVQLGHDPANR